MCVYSVCVYTHIHLYLFMDAILIGRFVQILYKIVIIHHMLFLTSKVKISAMYILFCSHKNYSSLFYISLCMYSVFTTFFTWQISIAFHSLILFHLV